MMLSRLPNIRPCFAIALAMLTSTAAPASEIGLEVAGQVDVVTWRHYLDDLLYAHAGDNRGIGGAHHDLARENIAATFASFGLPVERDEFLYSNQTYQNIVATKIGRLYPDQVFVIGAHYDSVGNPGADDDGSGVASLLELARIFAEYDTAYTIKFCAWDAEEVGLRGSTAYVVERRDQLVRGMIQIDMIAHNAGLNRQDIYAGTLAIGLRDGLMAAFPLYGNGQGVQSNPYAGFSDHAPFDTARYSAVCFVEDNYQSNTCYHQQCDNVDNPNYIHYDFAANFVRVIAGYLADNALAKHANDWDDDGTPDSGQIADNGALDCNGNDLLDAQEPGLVRDCNSNGSPDLCDIAAGTSVDIDRNGYADECQTTRLVPAQYATIQAAINAAVSGDTILVSAGVYSGAGNTALTFGGKILTLRSAASAGQTTIQCTPTVRGISFESGEDERCVLDGFTIAGGVGGIFCTRSGPTIRNCIITGHVTNGGVYLFQRSRPIISNCSIVGNAGGALGGGVYCGLGSNPLLINTVIAGNTATNGGGVFCDRTSRPTLRNCTIARNNASTRGGGLATVAGSTNDYSSPVLENCIVWGNTAPAAGGANLNINQSTFITARYCDIEGGQAGVVGGGAALAWDRCIEAAPLFADANANDYTLLASSPCIDAGSNGLAGADVGDVDFDGDAREALPLDRNGARRRADAPNTSDTGEGTAPLIDIGAFEFQPPHCPADFDGDGLIGLADLAVVLANFGCAPNPGACPGDMDGDGDVELSDLAALLAAFGTACR